MNDRQFERWSKWHNKGYKPFMIMNLCCVLGFYAFSGTVAYTQLYMTMPESLKERGVGVPLWPAILVIGIMTPLSVVWSHFTWKRNEAKYRALTEGDD